MITLAEAEHIAAGWAKKQTRFRGYACTPHVDELTLGYAVWMQLAPEARPEPGADVITIIDRETGRLSHWPPAPNDELDLRYNERRQAAIGTHQTADPVAELRRESHRRISPSVAAHITLGGRLFRARGAKGDQELRHHPIVEQLLAMIPAGHKIRGAERHAELLVVSDVLFEADKARDVPLTLDEARALLEQAHLETFEIRDPGDPDGGKPTHFCGTCSDMLYVLSVIPERKRTWIRLYRRTAGDDPQPGRFPPEVAWELAAGGWTAERTPEQLSDASGRMDRIVDMRAEKNIEFPLHRFPAADAAYAEFHRVHVGRNWPGVAQRVRDFKIGDFRGRYMADALHELGTIVGARMFPLGQEGIRGEAELAIDERGRVFALDQGGEWFIAETLDEALIALLTGLPAARIKDDGSWAVEQ